MQETIKPIDIFLGEANNGHAELVEASLHESGIVNNLYRGRDGTETLAFVRRACGGGKDATDVPSLLLLDSGLPRTGGIGVLKILKGDRRYRWLPVIIMTSASNFRQAEQYRRLGCEACITKWTVFLGLPGFMRRIRLLADRSVRTASHRLPAVGSLGCSAGTLDLRSVSDESATSRKSGQVSGRR
jgi:CheY-like chemotaxis protein